MKKFLIEVVIFSGMSLCLGAILSKHIIPKTQINPGVYHAIGNSLCNTPRYRHLIIGDSMGMQLYPCAANYSNIYSLTCNQAIMVAGHYFLLKNYLESNKETLPDEVILIYNPLSFRNNTDKYTFHYFLKPFLTHKYKQFYTESLWKEIKNVPLYWFSQFPFIKTSSWSVEYDYTGEKQFNLLSPISSDYLRMMVTMLNENNIAFKIVSPPLSEINRVDIESYWKEGLKNGEYEGIERIMTDYHNTFKYLPDSLFVDSIHLLQNNIPNDYLMINDDN